MQEPLTRDAKWNEETLESLGEGSPGNGGIHGPIDLAIQGFVEARAVTPAILSRAAREGKKGYLGGRLLARPSPIVRIGPTDETGKHRWFVGD